MEHASPYLHDVINFFRDGFRDGFAHVNGALGLIIAVFAAYQLTSWKRLWAAALGATILHLVAVVVLPVLVNEGNFRLPADLLEISYWKTAAALFLGYFVVVAVFFAIKTRLLPRGGAAHAH
jgi:prepilin signal peptidase PulO-like enzyme (type II secretory pathway)